MARVSFKTKSGKRVSFFAKPKNKTKSGKRVSFAANPKSKSKSGLSRSQKAKLSRAAKNRPRYKTGPKKGQFKKVKK